MGSGSSCARKTASYEPLTGQMVLDFEVEACATTSSACCAPAAKSARDGLRPLHAREPARRRPARPWTRPRPSTDRRSSSIRGSPSRTRTSATSAFASGDEADAEQLYRNALEIDGRQPEAHYNLGYVMLERGYARAPSRYFEAAIKADPRFADAHFNLAMAYEAVDEAAQARPLEAATSSSSPGTWADIARDHL